MGGIQCGLPPLRGSARPPATGLGRPGSADGRLHKLPPHLPVRSGLRIGHRPADGIAAIPGLDSPAAGQTTVRLGFTSRQRACVGRTGQLNEPPAFRKGPVALRRSVSPSFSCRAMTCAWAGSTVCVPVWLAWRAVFPPPRARWNPPSCVSNPLAPRSERRAGVARPRHNRRWPESGRAGGGRCRPARREPGSGPPAGTAGLSGGRSAYAVSASR